MNSIKKLYSQLFLKEEETQSLISSDTSDMIPETVRDRMRTSSGKLCCPTSQHGRDGGKLLFCSCMGRPGMNLKRYQVYIKNILKDRGSR